MRASHFVSSAVRSSTIAFGLFFALAAQSARGGVAISPDDPTSVQRGIEEAYRAGAKTVVIPPGVYRLPAPVEGDFHLKFADMKDFTIEATGAILVPTSREKRAFLIRNSENVTLRGATFLREVPPFSQGKIEAVAADRASADIRVDKGYPTDLDDSRYFPHIPVLDLYIKGTRQLKPLVPDLYIAKIERLGADLFRFHFRAALDPAIPIAIGDPAAWRGPSGSDISIWESAHMVLQDVTVKSGTGLTFFELAGEGENRYEHCVITYAPPPPGAVEEPLLASGTDGLHSACTRHGPIMEDCLFEGLNDDSVNIHGTYAMLMEAKGQMLVIDWRSPHTAAREPIMIGQPGDTLRVYGHNAAFIGEAKVVSVKPKQGYQPGDLGEVESRVFTHRDKAVYFEVQLDRPIAGEPGGFVANPSQCGSGFVIRHCTFRNSRGHGLFIRAGDGLIEGCTVEGLGMAGIVVAPEMNSWNEADYARHVTIQDNIIRNVGVGTQPWNSGITVAGFEFGRYAALPGGHRDITVRRNTFEDNRGPNLVVTSTIGVQIEDNHFIRPMTQPAFHLESRGYDNLGAVIWMRQASEVTMKGNTISAQGSYYKVPLDADATVSGSDLAKGVTAQP